MYIPLQRRSPDQYFTGRYPKTPGEGPFVWGAKVRKSVRAARKLQSSKFRRGRIFPDATQPDSLEAGAVQEAESAEQQAQPKELERKPVRTVPMTVPVAERAVTWRYLPGNRIRTKHALNISLSTEAGHVSTSRCGLYCWDVSMWHGTGSQGEYEKNDRLPRCRSCEKTLVEVKPTDEVPDGTGPQGWKSKN